MLTATVSRRPRIVTLTALLANLAATVYGQADHGPDFQVLTTPAGIRFGLLGEKGPKPAPTLLVFATSIEQTLTGETYAGCGRMLAQDGFLSVAMDIPCHGDDARDDEPVGLDGWRHRLENGEDMIAEFTDKVTAVLDNLVAEGYTDPDRVAACGTSRGGFIALHAAAADPRIKCVAAFAPVTDLPVLREFSGLDDHAAVKNLALAVHADGLAGRCVWMCIGNHDERVGTDRTMALFSKFVDSSVAAGKPADIELHVMPTIGHRIHATAHQEVAAWLRARLTSGGE